MITVFLADDHTIIRDGLKALLEANQELHVTGEASSGLETVQMVSQLQPDVILMDITMPGLSGIEATRRIKETCPNTQVIILSIHSATEHIIRALQAGARGYLLKECAGIEVVHAIRTVHSGHYYLSQKISDKVIEDYESLLHSREGESPLECLSIREVEVLQLIVEGRTNTEIASILNLSIKTVETYRSRLMHKLGINDIPTLVKFAIQHGLTTI